MADPSERPATACSRRSAARLLLGGSLAGLAASGVASAGGGDDFQYTMAFHSPYGKPVDYAFEVTEGPKALDHAPNLDIPDHKVSDDRGTEIDGAVARGTVNGGYDVFAYDGDLLAFEVTGGDCADLEVWETGTHLDACQLQSQLPGFGGTTDCDPTVVDSCQEIDSSGYYVLESDIDGANDYATKDSSGRKICIDITADDVVFDGRGYAINGPTEREDVGLRVTGDDVVVRDVDVIDWGICVQLDGDRTMFREATIENDGQREDLRLSGLTVTGTACTVHDVEVHAGFMGANLESATDTVLADSDIRGFNQGIVFGDATGCVLRNNAFDSGGPQALTMGNSHDNLLVGNAFSGAFHGGSVEKSHRNVFRANQFDPGVDISLRITNAEELVLLGNEASDGFAGISLEDVTDSVVLGNTTNDASQFGLQIDGGSNNVLTLNEAKRNVNAGIQLTSTVENVLTANTVKENSSNAQKGGVNLANADRNTVVRNTVCMNGGPSQIVVDGSSSGNQISNNDTSC